MFNKNFFKSKTFIIIVTFVVFIGLHFFSQVSLVGSHAHWSRGGNPLEMIFLAFSGIGLFLLEIFSLVTGLFLLNLQHCLVKEQSQTSSALMLLLNASILTFCIFISPLYTICIIGVCIFGLIRPYKHLKNKILTFVMIILGVLIGWVCCENVSSLVKAGNKILGRFNQKFVVGYNKELVSSIVQHDYKEAKSLIRRGANINFKDKDNFNKTPLLILVERGILSQEDKDFAKYLIEKGADVNAVDDFNQSTFLQDAITYSATDAAVLAVEKGADLSVKTEEGLSPLHLAIYKSNNQIAKAIILKKGNINAQDNCGWTPLHLAAYMGNKEIVSLLLSSGAQINALNDDGRTPLDVTPTNLKREANEIAKILRSQGGESKNQERIFGYPYRCLKKF